MKIFRIFCFVIIILPLSLKAQEESVGSIGTDRPVQSETPTVIPKKYIQFEEGVYYEQGVDFTCDNRSSTDLLAYNLLMKYGLVKNLELRLTFDYNHFKTTEKAFEEDQVSTIGGVNAPNVGLKYAFLKQEKGWKPNLTLSAHSQFDWWGREEFQPEEANINFRLTAGKNIYEKWYVIAGFGKGATATQFSELGYFYVFQTGYTFFNKLTALMELYGNRSEKFEVNTNALNGGLVYLINDNHQIDLSGGMGLNDNFYKYYVALGYSMRFHH